MSSNLASFLGVTMNITIPPHSVYRLTVQPYFNPAAIWVGLHVDVSTGTVYWNILPFIGIRVYIAGFDMLLNKSITPH